MRLTLRTLLAYLDDTLEPAQAKLIGQKVAESDTAQELIARLKEVTRRRRITTPTASGPGAKVDPNTIAEYLDNELSPDQLAEVEQLALASDVHLAEIAACHQILTLVLGEPALVPPSAYKRMYKVVKPPESDHAHRPPAQRGAEDMGPEEPREVDETLRLGLPALKRGGSWGNSLILLGGVAAVFLLLAFAIWQLLPPFNRDDTGEPHAKGTGGTFRVGWGVFEEKKAAPKVETGGKAKKETEPKEKKQTDGSDKATEPKEKDKKSTEPNDKKVEPKEIVKENK